MNDFKNFIANFKLILAIGRTKGRIEKSFLNELIVRIKEFEQLGCEVVEIDNNEFVSVKDYAKLKSYSIGYVYKLGNEGKIELIIKNGKKHVKIN